MHGSSLALSTIPPVGVSRRHLPPLLPFPFPSQEPDEPLLSSAWPSLSLTTTTADAFLVIALDNAAVPPDGGGVAGCHGGTDFLTPTGRSGASV